MFRSHTVHRFIPCMLLLLASLSSSGEGRPHKFNKGTPEVDRTDRQRALLLEAVKTGILNSLGMDREPRPSQKASDEELRKMNRLYRDKLREMAGNSSQEMRKIWQYITSTVLFPPTVRPIKVHRRGEEAELGQRKQWYRAVFQKKPDIHADLTLARAELTFSRHILDKPDVKQEIEVKVNRMKPKNSPVHVNVSSTQDVILDVTPEVDKWMRTDDGGQALVVDVGVVVGGKDAFKASPTISLELGHTLPTAAQRTRLPRSNKEDECDERGWCCRKSVTVSFKDIGWSEWVVAPTEYTMHFCDGTCPHNYKPASMHTQVKSRLHHITKGETPRPCCVPASYEPMVLMHYDSRGTLKLTPFNDLIVSKCHCA